MLRSIVWLYNDLKIHKRIPGLLFFLFYLLVFKLFQSKSRDKIWIIGEARGECTNDNGYHFFKYCREQHYDRKVYFLINKSSVHFKHISQDRNVLKYGSLEHFKTYIKSEICFFTHTYSDFCYREHFLIYHRNKKLIFLHHGVLGFKKFSKRYNKNKELIDLFFVGNKLEKQIITDEIGIKNEKTKITGYARYDSMNNSSCTEFLQIAYMPTHRDWLKIKPTSFESSIFFVKITEFLNSKNLHIFLSQKRITLKVLLHPIMKNYTGVFNSHCPWIKILFFGEETPQQLICESNLLITDYSSVSFDFLFLNKPVLFYRFDIFDYLNRRGSYLPLDKPLFGDIYFEHGQLIKSIIDTYNSNFYLKNEYKYFRDSIMPIIDNNNSKRIYETVVSNFEINEKLNFQN